MTRTPARVTITSPAAYTPAVTVVAESGMGRYAIAIGAIAGRTFVALPDYGKAAQMGARHVTPDYVAEKLRLLPGDAEAVSRILNGLDLDTLLAEAEADQRRLEAAAAYLDACGFDPYADDDTLLEAADDARRWHTETLADLDTQDAAQ